MNARSVLRVFAWALATGFLLDVLRRCWIVEAWSIALVIVLVLVFVLRRLRAAWRTARHQARPAAFVRPKSPDFPDQPRHGIR